MSNFVGISRDFSWEATAAKRMKIDRNVSDGIAYHAALSKEPY